MLLDAKSYYTDDDFKIYSIVHEQIERQSSGSYVVNDNLAARNIVKKLKRYTEDEKQFLNELMKDRMKDQKINMKLN